MEVSVIAVNKLAIVLELRAGIGMSDSLLELIPSALIGHIGVYRAVTLHPVGVFGASAGPGRAIFILCDPMVATGNSAVYAVDVLKRRGASDKRIMVFGFGCST